MVWKTAGRLYSRWGTVRNMIQKDLTVVLIVELHAEVFYAECSLLEALLTFLQVSVTIHLVI